MRLTAILLVFLVFCIGACGSEDTSVPGQEQIVQAYDTIEIQYQKLSELATDLIDNVESDDSIKLSRLYELVDNIPNVTLDFKNIAASRSDIRNFIAHQTAIENELRHVFAQLDSSSSWKNAPLVQEMKARFESDEQGIAAAKTAFDKTVDDARLDLKISPSTVSKQ
jgi:hypothetical protein